LNFKTVVTNSQQIYLVYNNKTIPTQVFKYKVKKGKKETVVIREIAVKKAIKEIKGNGESVDHPEL
jgi:hypothetical protein